MGSTSDAARRPGHTFAVDMDDWPAIVGAITGPWPKAAMRADLLWLDAAVAEGIIASRPGRGVLRCRWSQTDHATRTVIKQHATPRLGDVYWARLVGSEYIKIGWTTKGARERVGALPGSWELVESLPGSEANEKACHAALAVFRAPMSALPFESTEVFDDGPALALLARVRRDGWAIL